MNRKLWIAATALVVLVGAAVGAQTAQPGQDLRKVRQELETMKAILQTTLRYAVGEDRLARGPLVFEQEIDSYYLPGQGAVFMVPVNLGGSMPGFQVDALQSYLEAAEGQEISERVLRELERDMERATRDAHAAIADAQRELVWAMEGETPGPPEAPPAPESPRAVGAPPPPPAPPAEAPPAPEQGSRDRRRAAPAENSRQRLEKLRTRLDKQKEELEKERQNSEAAFAKIREGLMESLSKHGDSLSILRPEESITLILKRESGWGHFRGPLLGGAPDESESRTTVLSVKKSDVSDFKAGRIGRDQFFKRVLEYRQ